MHLSLSATGTLNTQNVWFPVSLKVSAFLCLFMRCRISCHLALAPISPLTPSYLPALTVLVRCSERLASRCGPPSPGWSSKNSLALALPRIYPQTPMILCSGRPRMSSENRSPGAMAAGAPGPCSWCLFHFLSGNTFPLVFTETVCLDGMRFCY